MNASVIHECDHAVNPPITRYPFKHREPWVKFCQLYQPAFGYMSLCVVLCHEPRKSDGGFVEFDMSNQTGSINASQNPTVVWHDDVEGYLRRRWFETVEARKDRFQGKVDGNRLTFETWFKDGDELDKHLSQHGASSTWEMPIFKAADLMQTLSFEAFKPRMQEIIRQKREEAYGLRLQQRVSMIERLAKLEERIALGTSIPEEWEPKEFGL